MQVFFFPSLAQHSSLTPRVARTIPVFQFFPGPPERFPPKVMCCHFSLVEVHPFPQCSPPDCPRCTLLLFVSLALPPPDDYSAFWPLSKLIRPQWSFPTRFLRQMDVSCSLIHPTILFPPPSPRSFPSFRIFLFEKIRRSVFLELSPFTPTPLRGKDSIFFGV